MCALIAEHSTCLLVLGEVVGCWGYRSVGRLLHTHKEFILPGILEMVNSVYILSEGLNPHLNPQFHWCMQG